MFEHSGNRIYSEKFSNYTLEKIVTISENISAFIVVDALEKRIGDIISNKIVDYIIDNIPPDSRNIYDNLSLVLDFLNGFFKSFNLKGENIGQLSIIIGILEDNKFHFSKIGNASLYLVQDNELTEISQSSDSSKNNNEFSYISSGSLRQGDLIIMATTKLTDYLTKSDFIQSYDQDSLKITSENIQNILISEELGKNIELSSFVYSYEKIEEKQNQILEYIKHYSLLLLDNNYTKKTFARALVLKDKFDISDKIFRNFLFVAGIAVSISLLYLIIGGIISGTSNSMNISKAKEQLIEARDYLRVANENMNNPDVFDLNIKKVETITSSIKSSKLFTNDVDKIIDDMSILKKQYDGVETFETSTSNLIYRTESLGFLKIIKINKKSYIVNKDFILGPIVSGEKPKKYIFDKLDGDNFIDAKSLDNKIVLLTQSGRIVSFDKSFEFKFINVIGQDKWENSKVIDTFGTNIYLLDGEKNQIFKHKTAVNGYSIGQGFIEDNDLKTMGKIASFAVDGGIYILKQDLSMVKLFSSPKYSLQTITLNKLPKNYKSMSAKDSIITTRDDLNYLYMLINNTIFVFEPSSRRYQDVKALTYIGQIEGKKYKIDDFYVEHDGDLIILNETGLYKLGFDISDGKLMLK